MKNKFKKLALLLAAVTMCAGMSAFAACDLLGSGDSSSGSSEGNSQSASDVGDENSSVTDEPIGGEVNENTYVFEAEYVDVSELEGSGYSGGGSGIALILTDWDHISGASNDFSLNYLFTPLLEFEFHITSDKAVDDAKLVLRMMGDWMNYTLKCEEFGVYVNGSRLNFEDIAFDVPHDDQNPDVRDTFEDYDFGTISLKEGDNVILMRVENASPLAGTMYATAPVLDCIKIETEDAELTWTAGYCFEENIENKSRP